MWTLFTKIDRYCALLTRAYCVARSIHVVSLIPILESPGTLVKGTPQPGSGILEMQWQCHAVFKMRIGSARTGLLRLTRSALSVNFYWASRWLPCSGLKVSLHPFFIPTTWVVVSHLTHCNLLTLSPYHNQSWWCTFRIRNKYNFQKVINVSDHFQKRMDMVWRQLSIYSPPLVEFW